MFACWGAILCETAQARYVVSVSAARQEATEAILDAAECLLVDVGYARITTRRLAERAGVNPGLVHDYFGSMEEVLLQAVERFTSRLAELLFR